MDSDTVPTDLLHPTLSTHVVASIKMTKIEILWYHCIRRAILYNVVSYDFLYDRIIHFVLLLVTYMLFQVSVVSTCEVYGQLFVSEESTTK